MPSLPQEGWEGGSGVQASTLPMLSRDKVGIWNDLVALPCDVINQPCLQEQVSPGQQVVTDQILIGSHCNPVAET